MVSHNDTYSSLPVIARAAEAIPWYNAAMNNTDLLPFAITVALLIIAWRILHRRGWLD